MMDQIYNDFVTKMLPQIQEGLTITKEYFLDLFGRYITYLIVSDLINLGIAFLVMIGGVIAIRKIWKSQKIKDWEDEKYVPARMILSALIAVLMLVFFFVAIDQIFDLAKAIYIPEIRVYEEINAYVKRPQ